MNKHEQHLIALLRDAITGDYLYLERKIEQIQEYSWPPEDDALPWNPRFRDAIDNLTLAMQDFEPIPSLQEREVYYGHGDMVKLIRNILDLVACESRNGAA